jgi:hypothetical protein
MRQAWEDLASDVALAAVLGISFLVGRHGGYRLVRWSWSQAVEVARPGSSI